MTKVYLNDSKSSHELKYSPKEEVLNAILGFSQSLEVLKPKSLLKMDKHKHVEIILN
jgi:hypothetical protein